MKMYLFEGRYINTRTGKGAVKKVEFNGQSLDSEKECYLEAMGMAYDMIESDEEFVSLEFLGC